MLLVKEGQLPLTEIFRLHGGVDTMGPVSPKLKIIFAFMERSHEHFVFVKSHTLTVDRDTNQQ